MPISRMIEPIESDGVGDVTGDRRQPDRGRSRPTERAAPAGRRRRRRRTRTAGSGTSAAPTGARRAEVALDLRVERVGALRVADLGDARSLGARVDRRRRRRAIGAHDRSQSPSRRACRTRQAPNGRPSTSPRAASPATSGRCDSATRTSCTVRRKAGDPAPTRDDWISTRSLGDALDVSGVEHPLGARVLAARVLDVGQLDGTDGVSDHHRDDDQRQPAERRGLPVRGAPAPCASGQIRPHDTFPLLDFGHAMRLPSGGRRNKNAARRPGVGLPPVRGCRVSGRRASCHGVPGGRLERRVERRVGGTPLPRASIFGSDLSKRAV